MSFIYGNYGFCDSDHGFSTFHMKIFAPMLKIFGPVVVTVAVAQTDEDEQEDEEEEEAAGHPVHDGGGDGDGHRVHHHWARSHPHGASYWEIELETNLCEV